MEKKIKFEWNKFIVIFIGYVAPALAYIYLSPILEDISFVLDFIFLLYIILFTSFVYKWLKK